MPFVIGAIVVLLFVIIISNIAVRVSIAAMGCSTP